MKQLLDSNSFKLSEAKIPKKKLKYQKENNKEILNQCGNDITNLLKKPHEEKPKNASRNQVRLNAL